MLSTKIVSLRLKIEHNHLHEKEQFKQRVNKQSRLMIKSFSTWSTLNTVQAASAAYLRAKNL